MNKNLQNKSRSNHPKTTDLYNKEYHDCKDQFQREKKSALIASDNGKCWWIYQFIMNTRYIKSDNS